MSTLKAYLTIDDSPTENSDTLVDFLAARNIPAMLFCRGDRLEQNATPMVRAIEKGMVLANHSYSHRAAGTLTYEEVVEEIERTEHLIDTAYRSASTKRPGKYFRFPYLDKGDGDKLEQRFGEIIANASAIDLAGDEKVRRLQDYLKKEGFTQPFTGVTHPLYRNKDVAQAADCLFTYSSCDWMLTTRHKGKWDYKTLDDLKHKIDDDPFLCREDGAQITLFHDQPEIERVAVSLIQAMVDKGFAFLDFEQSRFHII